jgi:hypothetical protein
VKKVLIPILAIIGVVVFFASQSEVPVEEAALVDESKSEHQEIELFELEGYDAAGKKAWMVKGDMAHVAMDNNIFIEKNVRLTIREETVIEADKVYWRNEAAQFITQLPVRIIHKDQTIEGVGALGKANEEFVQINQDISMLLNGPVSITAKGPAKLFRKQNRAMLYRDVTIRDKKGTLRCDRLEVLFEEEENRIKQVIAKGNVVVHQGVNTSVSDVAIYDTDTQSIKLLGTPKIQIDEKEMQSRS